MFEDHYDPEADVIGKAWVFVFHLQGFGAEAPARFEQFLDQWVM